MIAERGLDEIAGRGQCARGTARMPGEHVRQPIVYLRAMPDRIEIGAWGNPYMVCPACERGALQGMHDPQGYGSMLICVRGCGQRFWIDKPVDLKDAPG